MIHDTLIASQSGIPEGLEAMLPPGSSYAVLILITLAGIGLLGGGLAYLERNPQGMVGIFLGCIGLLVSCMAGIPMLSHIFSDNTEDIRAATLHNVEENFDINDISVKNIDHYSDKNRTLVEGSHNGKFIKFQVVYSAEHDVMLPVDTTQDIPIRSGSDLEHIIN